MTHAWHAEQGQWVADDDAPIADQMIRIRVTQQLPDREIARVSSIEHSGAFVGEVVGCGSTAAGLSVGDRVSGFAPVASTLTMPAEWLTRVPSSLPSAQGIAVPLLSLATQAVRRARPRPQSRTLVVGHGRFAELVARVFAVCGITQATVYRAEDCCDVSAPGVANGSAPEIAVDTTGDPAVVLRLLESTARLGRVVLLGSSRGRASDVDFYRTVHHRGLELIGVSDVESCTALGTASNRGQDTDHAIRLLGAHGDEIMSVLMPGSRRATP